MSKEEATNGDPTLRDRLFLRAPHPKMFRRAPTQPLRNTDDEVDCTPYEHVMYRPMCQTVKLHKRRQRSRRKKLPTIIENLCMFEWLHRTGAYKGMTNEDLLYVLTNGLFAHDKNNVAIVINRDARTGKSVTSQLNATFGKAESRADALKTVTEAHHMPPIPIEVPAAMQKIQLTAVRPPVPASPTDVITID